MKKCPYCFEEIKDEAIVCRYCRRELPGYEEEMRRRRLEAGRLVQPEGVKTPAQPVVPELPSQQDRHDDTPPQTPIIEAINQATQIVPQELLPQQEKPEDTPIQTSNNEEMNRPTGIVMQEIPIQEDKHNDIPSQIPKPNSRKNILVALSLLSVVILGCLCFICYLGQNTGNFNLTPVSGISNVDSNTNVSQGLDVSNSTSMPNPTKTEAFTETPIPTDTLFPTVTPEPPGETRDNPAPMGVPVFIDGMNIIITGVERPVDQKIKDANMFNPSPDPGNEVLMVHIKADCLGERDKTCYLSSSDFSLSGSRGIVYGYIINIAGIRGELESTQFFGGASVSGWMAYEVGQEENGLILSYSTFLGLSHAYLAIPDK